MAHQTPPLAFNAGASECFTSEAADWTVLRPEVPVALTGSSCFSWSSRVLGGVLMSFTNAGHICWVSLMLVS